MWAIVVIIGLIILGVGITVLIRPEVLRKMLKIFLARHWWSFVTMIRVLVGVLLMLAASGSRAPTFIIAVGILFILSGVTVPLMGTPRIERLAGWWLERSNTMLRLWGLLAAVIGAAIVWAGL